MTTQAFNSLGNIFRLFTESTMSYHQLDLSVFSIRLKSRITEGRSS